MPGSDTESPLPSSMQRPSLAQDLPSCRDRHSDECRPGSPLRGQQHLRLAGDRDALSRLWTARPAHDVCPARRSMRVRSSPGPGNEQRRRPVSWQGRGPLAPLRERSSVARRPTPRPHERKATNALASANGVARSPSPKPERAATTVRTTAFILSAPDGSLSGCHDRTRQRERGRTIAFAQKQLRAALEPARMLVRHCERAARRYERYRVGRQPAAVPSATNYCIAPADRESMCLDADAASSALPLQQARQRRGQGMRFACLGALGGVWSNLPTAVARRGSSSRGHEVWHASSAHGPPAAHCRCSTKADTAPAQSLQASSSHARSGSRRQAHTCLGYATGI